MKIVWLNGSMQFGQHFKSSANHGHSRQSLSILFFFLPDLTRVKFGSACPPLGRCYRAHPPGQALPNFLPPGSPHPPCLTARAFRQSDRSTCHWQVAQTVLWHPALGGGAGDQMLGSGTTPNIFLRPFVSCRISNQLYRPNRPCPSLTLSGNRTDQSATGRLIRRSSGTRFSRAVRAITGDRLSLPVFRLLQDKTGVHFCRTGSKSGI